MSRRISVCTLVMALLTLCAGPAAMADTFTATGAGTNTVDVSLPALQYSMKIQDGSDFSFNCTGCNLTNGQTYDTSISGSQLFGSYLDVIVSGTTYYAYFTTKIGTGNSPGGTGPFDYSLTQIDPLGSFCTTIGGTTCYGSSVTSVDSLHLKLASGTFGTNFGLHICDSDSPTVSSSPNCAPDTYFVQGPGGTTFSTPEPATLSLFGAGLLSLGAMLRRKRR